MIINKKCDCGNKSTGNTTIRCCNLCGLPIPTEPWHFNLEEDIFNQAGAMPEIVDIKREYYEKYVIRHRQNREKTLFSNYYNQPDEIWQWFEQKLKESMEKK